MIMKSTLQWSLSEVPQSPFQIGTSGIDEPKKLIPASMQPPTSTFVPEKVAQSKLHVYIAALALS